MWGSFMTPSSPPWVRDLTESSSLSKYPSSHAGTTSRMMSWRNGSTDSSSQVCGRISCDSRSHASCVSVNVIDGNSCPGDFLCVVSVFAHGIQVIIAYSWVFGCNQILLTCMSVSICDQRFSLICRSVIRFVFAHAAKSPGKDHLNYFTSRRDDSVTVTVMQT
jgi:hypothetical protein